ncbi:phage regulatory CII family protein [Bermanella sp. R86510]|uniref:phage regulatory CII family protein n=1 Tax=unclassified Bermanella TaxID=2627862 RepID=UPI0037CA9864
MENLVTACRDVVKSFPGGIEAVAAKTGIRSLQQKLNPACERNKLSAEDVDTILQLTRGYEILDVICKRLDAAWIDLSDLKRLPCDASMLDNITDLVTKLGVLTSNVQISLADGVVDVEEMHQLETASLRLISASMTVVRRAEQFMPEVKSA